MEKNCDLNKRFNDLVKSLKNEILTNLNKEYDELLVNNDFNQIDLCNLLGVNKKELKMFKTCDPNISFDTVMRMVLGTKNKLELQKASKEPCVCSKQDDTTEHETCHCGENCCCDKTCQCKTKTEPISLTELHGKTRSELIEICYNFNLNKFIDEKNVKRGSLINFLSDFFYTSNNE